jgi:hypothetical protein
MLSPRLIARVAGVPWQPSTARIRPQLSPASTSQGAQGRGVDLDQAAGLFGATEPVNTYGSMSNDAEDFTG